MSRSIVTAILLLPLGIGAVGHHTFTNDSDMRLHISVLYHACTLDKHHLDHKGAVDKKGKPLSNQWTTPGNICCVRRVDFRDADVNKFLRANDQDLQIKIDNISNTKLTDALVGIGLGLAAVPAVITGAAAVSTASTVGEALIGLGGAGVIGGISEAVAMPAVFAATDSLIKKNVHPVIECSANSHWHYSGSNGSYTLVGPQGYAWKIEIPARKK